MAETFPNTSRSTPGPKQKKMKTVLVYSTASPSIVPPRQGLAVRKSGARREKDKARVEKAAKEHLMSSKVKAQRKAMGKGRVQGQRKDWEPGMPSWDRRPRLCDFKKMGAVEATA
ncbi:hypothetical protein OF83DRAFT_1129586 [Amylostereum chailletii]|nr:hypothetical protein OF83DRAFT_1129586 [Amylostereum chailletii]